jgi:hypothetical protein
MLMLDATQALAVACELCGTPYGRVAAPDVSCPMCDWPDEQPRRSAPPASHERPLDALLERLRRHGLSYRPAPSPQSWTAACPSCRGEALRLNERRDEFDLQDLGDVSLSCSNGCHPARILEQLSSPAAGEGVPS